MLFWVLRFTIRYFARCRQVKVLLLSYQNILKVDNLVGFDKLAKLQLDNNIIEKIENLSHLTYVMPNVTAL